MSQERSKRSHRSPSAPFLSGVLGFVAGVALVFMCFVWPQQRLMLQKDALVNGMVELNLKEQNRLADMRDISEAQLRKWVALNEESNRKYQEIFETLHRQERFYANPGLYWTTLMLVFLCVLVGFYIWANRNENIKDLTTLENFETFIEQRLSGETNAALLSSKDQRALVEGSHIDTNADGEGRTGKSIAAGDE